MTILLLFLLQGYKANDHSYGSHQHKEDHSEDYSDHSSESHESDEDDDKNTPSVEEPIEEVHDDPNHPHINFISGSEEEHLRNFKRISADLQLFEDEYLACLDEIQDEDFTETAVEGCLGKDFLKLQLDIKYETMKIISKAEDKLRHFFVYHCYIPVGEDEMKTVGCDLLQRDMLDAIWNCMDFIDLANLNRNKYIKEYAILPSKIFKDIIFGLETLHKEFFELIEEVDAHKQLTILRIKNHIDDKTKVVIKKLTGNQRNLTQPSVVTQMIKIQERVNDPNFRLTNTLPRMGFLPDGSYDPNYTLYAKDLRLDGLDSRGEKDSRLRMLNLSNGYSGLHSANREDNKPVRRTNISLKDGYRKTVQRLNRKDNLAPMDFKNTHTAYMSKKHRRFK